MAVAPTSVASHPMQVRPFLKWAGGKRQLIPTLLPYIPQHFGTYYEPFLGGGALLFALQPRRAIVNDVNAEIINCYVTIRDHVEDLIALLHTFHNDEQSYYAVRHLDRDITAYAQLSAIERAGRIIYLNKTCYNGLFRVNSHGQFNVPFGCYAHPLIADEPVLHAVSNYLQSADITFLVGDFADAVATAQRDDFVYFDPPYDPLTKSASFTSYAREGFGQPEQYSLRLVADELHQRNVKILLSNHATAFIDTLYQGYSIAYVAAKRAINSAPQKRGNVQEVLVWNYSTE